LRVETRFPLSRGSSIGRLEEVGASKSMFKHYESCNISCACSSCFSTIRAVRRACKPCLLTGPQIPRGPKNYGALSPADFQITSDATSLPISRYLNRSTSICLPGSPVVPSWLPRVSHLHDQASRRMASIYNNPSPWLSHPGFTVSPST